MKILFLWVYNVADEIVLPMYEKKYTSAFDFDSQRFMDRFLRNAYC